MTLTIHAMRPGDPRSICGEGKVFSGVPSFVTCVACRSLTSWQAQSALPVTNC